jgi:DNA polymerase-4
MTADILHVDLDCFYVAVERRKDPSLRGRPVVVGGAGGRGVVLSCSYEARATGVRNAMPSARARRLCRDAVFVPPDFEAYAEASKAFRAVLDSFTPKVEPISLDEAFCDVSGAHTLYGSSGDIAEAMRASVREELELDASVGGGPTKLVAKVASRTCKPDGVLLVDDPVAFLHPMPVEELWGVGEITAAALRRLGITTIGDLARFPKDVLKQPGGGTRVRSSSARPTRAWGPRRRSSATSTTTTSSTRSCCACRTGSHHV